MSICCIPKPSRPTPAAVAAWKRFLLLLTLLFAWNSTITTTRGAEVDDQYLKIFRSIESADELVAKHKSAEAKAKYEAAYKELSQFRKNFPAYNAKLVNFRLNDLNTKIELLSRPAPEASTETTVAPAKAVDKNQPQLKLLDAGAEPRQVLRWRPKPEGTQKIKLTDHLKMELLMAELPPQAVPVPVTKTSFTLTLKAASSEGEQAFEILVTDVEILKEAGDSDQMVEALKTRFGTRKGLTLTGTMTDRLLITKLKAQMPSGVTPEMRENLEQVEEKLTRNIVLPEEAVGVGAHWEMKQKIKSGGINIDQVMRYELVSITDNIVVVKSIGTQSAANQKIPNPVMPGLNADLIKMSGNDTRTTTIDLMRLMPVLAKTSDRMETVMAISNAGKKQQLTMKFDGNSVWESE